MKKFLIGAGIVALIALILLVIYPITVKNGFVRSENSLEELHKESLNALSEMTGNIKLQGSAAKSADDLLLEVIARATGGTFGPDGAQQSILLLQQEYPQIPLELKQQYMRAIEAGYAKFARVQTQKLRLLKIYKSQTDPVTFPSGYIAQSSGFPRIDLAQFDIILSKEAKQADATKEFDPASIDPFAK